MVLRASRGCKSTNDFRSLAYEWLQSKFMLQEAPYLYQNSILGMTLCNQYNSQFSPKQWQNPRV